MNNYNYLGNDISDVRIRLLSDEYGYVDENNIPHINWGIETNICDPNGFDKRFRPMEGSQVYVIDDYVLPKGTVICRYGFPGGRFTTMKGFVYESLGLPYVKETIEYHEYSVVSDLNVDCYVIKGVVAPKFMSNGGAIQFMHKQSIALECEDGYLKEDFLWIQKNI